MPLYLQTEETSLVTINHSSRNRDNRTCSACAKEFHTVDHGHSCNEAECPLNEKVSAAIKRERHERKWLEHEFIVIYTIEEATEAGDAGKPSKGASLEPGRGERQNWCFFKAHVGLDRGDFFVWHTLGTSNVGEWSSVVRLVSVSLFDYRVSA